MSDTLIIKAGKTALAHIRENGLAPEDITAVFGASGAAKWLSIYGLDRAVFSQWLSGITHRICLLGTSVGAWKLTAAAQQDPGRAFDRFKDAYISQTYRGRVTPQKITTESLKILNRFVPAEKIHEILSHPFLKLGFLSVRCKNAMASEKYWAQGAGVMAAALLNLGARKTQRVFFERVLFQVPGTGKLPIDMQVFGGDPVDLDRNNFYSALMSSGSIPLVMEGVYDIPGAQPGVYRDGGILDYHPTFPLKSDESGFILYPHFYPYLIPGWFDKALEGRHAGGRLVDRIILVAPSPEYVAGLPLSRIPDRKDFIRFRGNDRGRYQIWHSAASKSLELGHRFLTVVNSGEIREMACPFST
ncbi:MAG: hypothetical protein CSA29_00405 [Desulfobacterales bacterium]|nr:MAG: hypothetical protein CSA29_00405 [Desulfobacterales bacterium]